MGRQCTTNTVHCRDGVLLFLTQEIVDRWSELYEDLLNPTETPSFVAAESGDLRCDSSVSGVEVTEVVKKVLGRTVDSKGTIRFLS